MFSLLYTHAVKSALFSRYIWPFDSFPQNWVIIDILVCPVYVLHEFIVLENSKFSLFPSLFYCLSFLSSLLLHHGSYISIAQLFCPFTLGLLHHLFSGMLTALFSSGWLHILGQVECSLLVLIVPQTLAFLSSNVSANLTLFQKWLDRCDDSGLSCCLKVMKLCPPSFAPQLHISSCYRYNNPDTTSHTILTSTTCSVIFTELHIPNSRWPFHEIVASSHDFFGL